MKSTAAETTETVQITLTHYEVEVLQDILHTEDAALREDAWVNAFMSIEDKLYGLLP
jgi:hypothetical protein